MTDLDFTVYVPTMGRVHRQITAKSLEGTDLALGGRVLLVTPEQEAEDLSATATAHGLGVLALPGTIKGIGPTRQWIYENHDVHTLGGYLMMVDDDLRFFARRFDDQAKFTPLTEPGEMDVLLGRLRSMLDRVPLAGLDNRSGANRRKPIVQMNGRMHDLQAVNVVEARRLGLRFDSIRFMEDFHAVLQTLTQGYPTALLTTHCKDDLGGSNAAGGCSTYRDSAGQAAAALALWEDFPDFVRITKRPGWNGDMSGERTDVAVQWAKAFKAGTAAREEAGLDPVPEPDWSGLAPDWELL